MPGRPTPAADYARAGYAALAVDLYNGEVAADPQNAARLSRGLDGGQATETLVAWIDWLRASADVNGKVATIGWCFGGGWSLNASLAAKVDGTVIYYGNVTKKADVLAALAGPVLGHFGTLDRFINKAMVDGFTAEMDKAGKAYDVQWYEANHAFAGACRLGRLRRTGQGAPRRCTGVALRRPAAPGRTCGAA